MRAAGLDALGSTLKAKHLEREARAKRTAEEAAEARMGTVSFDGSISSSATGSGSGSGDGSDGSGDPGQWVSILEFIQEESRPRPGQSLSERHGCRLFSSTAEAANANVPSSASPGGAKKSKGGGMGGRGGGGAGAKGKAKNKTK